MNLSIDYAKGLIRLRLLFTGTQAKLMLLHGSTQRHGMSAPRLLITGAADTAEITQALLTAAGFKATHASTHSKPLRKPKNP